MKNAEMDAIARDIDAVTAGLRHVTVLKQVSPQGAAMGLALAAAAHVLHNDGSREDFMNLMTAAWTKAQKNHGG